MKDIFIGVAVVAVVLGVYALVALLFQVLWNWLMPFIFGLPELSYWMSVGFIIMIGILTSGLKYVNNS